MDYKILVGQSVMIQIKPNSAQLSHFLQELYFYADKEWAEQHPYIHFDTANEDRVYRVFAAFQTTIGGENEFKYNERAGKLNDEEYTAFVKDIQEASVMDTGDRPVKKSQIMMLSTCSYHSEDGRFVVAAYRV